MAPLGQTQKRREYMRAYYLANKQRAIENNRKWRAKNADRKKATDRQWRERNLDKARAAYRAWYARPGNKEKASIHISRWQIEHPEKRKAIRDRWRANHPGRERQLVREWRKANPEKTVQFGINRRARKYGNGGSYTVREVKAKFAALGGVCYYCWEAKPLTVDHDVPLSRGGTNDISNILPACKECNSRKSTRTSAEFLFRKTEPTKVAA